MSKDDAARKTKTAADLLNDAADDVTASNESAGADAQAMHLRELAGKADAAGDELADQASNYRVQSRSTISHSSIHPWNSHSA